MRENNNLPDPHLAETFGPTTKPTNPKDAVGSDKLPLHLWPESATAFGCIGLANGMLKYGRANWREAGVRPSIYIDACKRHLNDWFEGNESDPQDGVHNLSGALACLAIVVDALVTGKLNDDRNYNGQGWRKAREMMEPHVKRLKELHAAHAPKHWTFADNAHVHQLESFLGVKLPDEMREGVERASARPEVDEVATREEAWRVSQRFMAYRDDESSAAFHLTRPGLYKTRSEHRVVIVSRRAFGPPEWAGVIEGERFGRSWREDGRYGVGKNAPPDPRDIVEGPLP